MQRYFYNEASTPEWPVTRGGYARILDASRISELKIGIERLKIGLPAHVRMERRAGVGLARSGKSISQKSDLESSLQISQIAVFQGVKAIP